MEESNFNTTMREPDDNMYHSGIAYIVIPPDVDRHKYIQECYKTNTVSIYSENNGLINRVPIDKYSLNFIVFPKNTNEFGSPVSFKADSVSNCPIVDGIFCGTNEISDLVENQFKFKRKLNNNVVEISGSPDGKYIGLNVIADKNGEVFINVKSKDKSGKFTVNVEGDAVINSLNNLLVTQFGKFTSVTKSKTNEDEFTVHSQTSTDETFYNENHNINTKNAITKATDVLTEAPHVKFNKVEDFKINDGKEPFILGKKFAQFMKDFITEVSKATTTTMLGQMPILNAAEVAAYTEKVDELLSEIGFIDK